MTILQKAHHLLNSQASALPSRARLVYERMENEERYISQRAINERLGRYYKRPGQHYQAVSSAHRLRDDVQRLEDTQAHSISTLPCALRPVARAWYEADDMTKSALREKVRSLDINSERGGLSIVASIDAIEQAAKVARTFHKFRRRFGTPYTKEQKSARRRLDETIRSRAMSAWSSNYRLGTHGEAEVVLGSKPSVSVGHEKDWDMYSNSTKYPGDVWACKLTVARDWNQSVYHEGIAVLDGIMTLDAERIDESEDGRTRVYDAKWLHQGRGIADQEVYRGWIATDGTLSYHSQRSAEHALAGLRRKQNPRKKTKRRRTWITRRVARNAGLCKAGIESFVAAAGLTGRERIKADDLAALVRGNPRLVERFGASLKRLAEYTHNEHLLA